MCEGKVLMDMKQVKPIGFEAPRGGAYNNWKHLNYGNLAYLVANTYDLNFIKIRGFTANHPQSQ